MQEISLQAQAKLNYGASLELGLGSVHRLRSLQMYSEMIYLFLQT